LVEQDHLPLEDATRTVNDSFIEIKIHPRSGRREYKIYPPAIMDIRDAIQDIPLGRRPGKRELTGAGRGI
jgi:hypothetical protein